MDALKNLLHTIKTLNKKRTIWTSLAGILAIAAVITALAPDRFVQFFFVPMLFENDGPAKADIIFILGGDNELRGPLGARLLREGWAPKILLARVHDGESGHSKVTHQNETDALRKLLYDDGVKSDQIVEIRTPRGVDSTADEARVLKTYALTHPMNRVLIVTSSFHGHRARMTMQRALAATAICVRVVTAESRFASRRHWRDNEYGRKQVEREAIKMVYYFFTFFG